MKLKLVLALALLLSVGGMTFGQNANSTSMGPPDNTNAGHHRSGHRRQRRHHRRRGHRRRTGNSNGDMGPPDRSNSNNR